MSKLLTIVQEKRLADLERTIQETAGAFIECGRALMEIRDAKLYLKTHDSFEKYCEEKWHYHRSYAYRLIEASSAVSTNETSPIGDTIKNEAQARVLLRVPRKKRAAVVRAAAKRGPVTAKSLGAAAQTVVVVGAQNAELLRDASGYPVPPPALEYWNRRDEAKRYVKLISDARSAVRNLISQLETSGKKDLLYVEVNLQNVGANLSNAFTEMNLAVPRLVCGVCQGQTPKHCALCKGRGVISKNKWDLCVPSETKAIRAKSSKK